MATTKITSRSLETGAALANLNAGASVALTVPVTATNYNPGTNVATFLATPTSANLLAAVTDETGTGSLVFATSPTITTPTIAQINGGIAANDDLTLQGTTNATRTTSYVNLQPSGGNVGIGTATPSATLHTIALTEQMRIGYDAANYTSLTVSSAGNVTRNNTGTFVSQTLSGNQALYQGFSSSAVYMTIGGTTRGDGSLGKFNVFGTGTTSDAPIYVIWHTTDDSAGKNAGLITKTRMGSRYLKTYQTIGQNDNSFGNAGLVQFTAFEYSNSTYTTLATPTEFTGWNYQYYNGAAYESLLAVRKAGVGVGVVSPNAKAKLQVDSTTQGFLPPRMDTTQRNAIASPPAGLVIYNTTTSNLNSYSGSAWVELVDSADLGTNVATFLATPTSANLASALTDENGTGGGFVRAEGATLTSPSIAGTASFTDTTRPTSAGTGTPAATSLMTRDDVALEPFYSLGSVFRVSATPAFANSGTGSAALQGTGDRWVALSSGTSNSGYGRAQIGRGITTVPSYSGGGINFASKLGVSIILWIANSAATDTLNIFRLRFGSDNTPVADGVDAVAYRGFGVEIKARGTSHDWRVYGHDGTSITYSAWSNTGLNANILQTRISLSVMSNGSGTITASLGSNGSRTLSTITTTGGPTATGTSAQSYVEAHVANSASGVTSVSAALYDALFYAQT